MPVKNEVKEYFIKSWGEMARGGKWVGYRVRTLQDDLGDPADGGDGDSGTVGDSGTGGGD